MEKGNCLAMYKHNKISLLLITSLVLLCGSLNAKNLSDNAKKTDDTMQLSSEQKKSISAGLSHDCRVLLAECIHARNSIGDSVWNNWSKTDCPINVITKDYEYLTGFADPPEEYTLLEHDKLLNADIYVKKRTFKQLLVGSALPLAGKLAVFISPPELFIDTFKIDMAFCRILLLHEMFHVHQINHFPDGLEGIKAAQLEIKYPYKVELNNQLRGEEAVILKKAILADSKADKISQIELFIKKRQLRRERMKKEFPDKYDNKSIEFEKFQEWLEGQARYTEVKIEEQMQNPDYKAIPEFRCSRGNTFEREMNKLDCLAQNSGEESDYALGWAQWYVLDTLRPSWKTEAFAKNAAPESLLRKALTTD
ncbi:MAG: hypothetical protein KKB51_21830 [Candidatus Riflebacteria bacterium]|nr:hypothetical protein [Candidatus Riflebacteria bacterium]